MPVRAGVRADVRAVPLCVAVDVRAAGMGAGGVAAGAVTSVTRMAAAAAAVATTAREKGERPHDEQEHDDNVAYPHDRFSSFKGSHFVAEVDG
jgi:hypothetical protein